MIYDYYYYDSMMSSVIVNTAVCIESIAITVWQRRRKLRTEDLYLLTYLLQYLVRKF